MKEEKESILLLLLFLITLGIATIVLVRFLLL